MNNWFGFNFCREPNNASSSSGNQTPGYLFLWMASGAVYLRRRSVDVRSTSLTFTTAMKHWKVTKYGGNIKIYYDNQVNPIIDYTDSSPLTDTCQGFSLGHYGSPNYAIFDNYKCYSYWSDMTYSYNEQSDLLLTQKTPTSNITFITEPESYGSVIGMVKDGTPYYFLSNAHSDILAATDTTGKILTSWEYDSFGNPKEYTWNYDGQGNFTGKTQVSVGSFGNPYLYSSYYYDTETSMYYLNARYYSPTIGRFISRDPDGGNEKERLSVNVYAYCVNNPMIKVDPSGRAWDPRLGKNPYESIYRRSGYSSRNIPSAGRTRTLSPSEWGYAASRDSRWGREFSAEEYSSNASSARKSRDEYIAQVRAKAPNRPTAKQPTNKPLKVQTQNIGPFKTTNNPQNKPLNLFSALSTQLGLSNSTDPTTRTSWQIAMEQIPSTSDKNGTVGSDVESASSRPWYKQENDFDNANKVYETPNKGPILPPNKVRGGYDFVRKETHTSYLSKDPADWGLSAVDAIGGSAAMAFLAPFCPGWFKLGPIAGEILILGFAAYGVYKPKTTTVSSYYRNP